MTINEDKNTQKVKLGEIGMGHMGSHKAQRLLATGYPLIVYDRAREKAQALVPLGAAVADTPKNLAVNSKLVKGTMVMDYNDLPELEPVENGQDLRKRPGVERIYRNEHIAVSWEPRLCIHAGYCFRLLPQVFKPLERPWVNVNAALPEEVAATVMSCPTGALQFERLDGEPQEEGSEITMIQERTNGPLFLRGRLRIRLQDGSIREETRVALCRCGHSDNKPFCDGTHHRIGFRTVPSRNPE